MPVRNPYFAAAQGPAQSSTVNQWPKGWLADTKNTTGGDQSLGAVGAGSYDVTMDEVANVLIHTNRKIRIDAKITLTVGGTGSAKLALDIVEGGTVLEHGDEQEFSAGDVRSLKGWALEDIAVIGNHIYKPQLAVISIISGAPTFTISGSYPGNAHFLVADLGASS